MMAHFDCFISCEGVYTPRRLTYQCQLVLLFLYLTMILILNIMMITAAVSLPQASVRYVSSLTAVVEYIHSVSPIASGCFRSRLMFFIAVTSKSWRVPYERQNVKSIWMDFCNFNPQISLSPRWMRIRDCVIDKPCERTHRWLPQRMSVKVLPR